MNRRRNSTRSIGLGSTMLLIVAAVVIASCGVFYAYIKNRQVYLSRQIQSTEQRISQHELDIKTNQMMLDEQLNRFLIRDRLREIASDLRQIPVSELEKIDAYHREPPLPDLARSGP